MLERALRFSIERRGLVVAVTIALAALGLQALSRLPIDAVPDITNRQVKINAVAPALSPAEMERQVTFELETALAGIPGLAYTRSISRNGFSQVTAVFGDDVDIYFARQQVAERLAAADSALPSDVEATIGPVASGLSEIYMWTVEYAHPAGRDASPRDGEPGWQSDGSYLTPEGERLRSDIELASYLRTVQDWIIRPQMRMVPGLAGVDAVGGYVKQYQVQPDPRVMAALGITFHDLIAALERNNLNTGAGFIESNGEAYTVRAAGRLTRPEDLASITVAERGGTPVRVRDLAVVGIGGEARRGSASEDGEEVVLGIAIMLLGENSRTVAKAVDRAMQDIGRTLPPDIRVKTVLDRSQLVDATIRTVRNNLIEGALLVVAVLFVMLGNIRAALITATAIPLSMLLAAIGMVQTGTSGNLMSLGAIDFGLIVDGSVIIVENCLRRLAERQSALGRVLTLQERLDTVFAASRQVRSATAFGEAIIITVYIPILSLTGIEGKMFQPMAMTVIFALGAAFVLSLTFVPAMVAIFVRGEVRERENAAVSFAKRLYVPTVRWALRWRLAVVLTAGLGFAGSLLLFRTLGQEFAPTLEELDVLVHAIRIPSTGVDRATEMQRVLERRLRDMPEVAFVFSRTGTGEVGQDAMPPYVSDTFVILRPRNEWPNRDDTKAQVTERIGEIVEAVPGNAYEFTQPIQMLFAELLAGVRADLAIMVFGDEFDAILPAAQRIAAIVASIPGAADTGVEQVTGSPLLTIEADRDALARYGLDVADVHEVVSTAVGGHRAGELFQGDRRFDVVVRLAKEFREDLSRLENLPVPLSHVHRGDGASSLAVDDAVDAPYLPLSAVARLRLTDGPNQVSRENSKRRIVVQSNVRGRDIGSFVAEAQRRIAAEVTLPPGSWLSWGGEFENLAQAKRRLAVVVPICFLIVLCLLYGTFGALAPAAMVFTAVPLALSGGIVSLWLRDMPFSISAAVGFIALSGVAVLNGLVMVTFIDELRQQGRDLEEAIVEGAVTRLRPVLMTALVASLGFVPMAIASGTGAEVQRPLATVVIGGLVSSTALTLLVLPALYRIFFRPGPRGEP